MILWVLLAVICVAVIAFGSIGLLSRTLATTESAAVYDIAEATEWVSERLPDPLTARLSHDDVKSVLLSHLSFMRTNGFATFGGVDTEAMQAAFGGEDVVRSEDEVVDAILADFADRGDREIDAIDVVAIVDANNQYLEAIGALGARRTIGE